jgi:hypothetical protein
VGVGGGLDFGAFLRDGFCVSGGSLRPAGGDDSCQRLRRQGESHGPMGELGTADSGQGRPSRVCSVISAGKNF